MKRRVKPSASQRDLTALGYIQGKNIRVLYRYANLHADRLSALAIELGSLYAQGGVCSRR
jgi:hypothetical protein